MGGRYADAVARPESERQAGEASLVPAILRAMRPYQWPKNLLVFAALAFSAGEAWLPREPDTWWPLLWRSTVLFGLWCLAASGTYLVNDVLDRGLDRQHPQKRHRPIASGAVSVRQALTVAVILWAVSLPTAFVLDWVAGALLAGYVALMVGYSWWLKAVAVLDVLILCSGVIARAVAGGAAIDVHISPWLYVCTSFAAFFFASSKRWAEFRALGEGAANHRPALGAYTAEVLNQMVVVSASAALLSYALYTIESDNLPANGAMALTLPFVAFGMFRYLLLLHGKRRTDAPDQILFSDPQIVLAVLGFVGVALAVLIGHRT